MRLKITSFFALMFFVITSTYAETKQKTSTPQRPTILFNRWQEDWSVLADSNIPREPLDDLKYIPLSARDPKTYLSFGLNFRTRFEYNDAMNFGVGSDGVSQSYLINRLEGHADLRIANQVQIFVQLQEDYAPRKTIVLPVDADKLDLELAFITITEPIAKGTFKFRAGRQQFAFDLQRFISVRDGPNVRLSYDALWADYELEKWRFITFYSQPVQTLDIRCFDDYSSQHLTYGGFRVERKISDFAKLSSYISHFKQDNASFPSASGNENRNILDIRFAGNGKSFDWDLETMGQIGSIADKNIRAWAFGSVSGYTFEQVNLKPRIGLQLDAASGNQNPNGNTFGTFNPLFPNGEYVTLAGYTGYTNFIHLKPSLTIKPTSSLTAMLAVAAQWRASTADAVYTQPDNPIPGTVGLPGRYTGTYFQTRIDWQMTSHIHNALEVVQFNVADVIRQVGGHNSTYVGIESKFGW